jgi:hypothetical protein
VGPFVSYVDNEVLWMEPYRGLQKVDESIRRNLNNFFVHWKHPVIKLVGRWMLGTTSLLFSTIYASRRVGLCAVGDFVIGDIARRGQHISFQAIAFKSKAKQCPGFYYKIFTDVINSVSQ